MLAFINLNWSQISILFECNLLHLKLSFFTYHSVMLKLNVTWRDRRLDYLNLREDIYQNMLPDDEKQNIWKPEIGMISSYLMNCRDI